MKTKRIAPVLIGIMALLVVVIGQSAWRMKTMAQERSPYGTTIDKAELVAVTFSSQWCGPCKVLKPRLTSVKSDFSEHPIRFIELSFTFGDQRHYQNLAKEEGFWDVYQEYKGATGFTVLVDQDTGAVLDMLTVDFSKNAMRAAISRALSIATIDQDKSSKMSL